jgi:hypothetical protein
MGGTLILDVGLCCCGPKVVPSWSPLGFLAIPQWAPVVPKWTLRGPYVVPQRSLSGPFAAHLWTNLGSLMDLSFPPKFVPYGSLVVPLLVPLVVPLKVP